jgi:hypothetical protein
VDRACCYDVHIQPGVHTVPSIHTLNPKVNSLPSTARGTGYHHRNKDPMHSCHIRTICPIIASASWGIMLTAGTVKFSVAPPQALADIFMAQPEAVLASCLEALRRGAGNQFFAAVGWLRAHLLRVDSGEAPEPPGAAGRLPGDGQTSLEQPRSLVARAVGASPATQRWLQQAVAAFRRGGGAPSTTDG